MMEADFAAALPQLVPTWKLDEVSEVVYLSGGYSNRNYAFTHAGARYVLRIPQRSQPFVDRAHEQAWYARLPAAVAPLPIALDVDTGVMLTPWVEGELLVEAWPRLTEQELTDYLTQLHSRIPTDARRYDLADLMTAYGCTDEPFNAPPYQPQHLITCHNDLNPWNVLVTDTGWVTLDWEFVGLNDPMFDLVSLHQGLALPSEELPAFAQLFMGSLVSEAELMERLSNAEQAFWLREYGWARHQLAAGNVREEIKEQKELARLTLSGLKPR